MYLTVPFIHFVLLIAYHNLSTYIISKPVYSPNVICATIYYSLRCLINYW